MQPGRNLGLCRLLIRAIRVTLGHHRELVFGPITAAPVFKEWVLGYISQAPNPTYQEPQLVGMAKAWLRVTMDMLWGSLNSFQQSRGQVDSLLLPP